MHTNSHILPVFPLNSPSLTSQSPGPTPRRTPKPVTVGYPSFSLCGPPNIPYPSLIKPFPLRSGPPSPKIASENEKHELFLIRFFEESLEIDRNSILANKIRMVFMKIVNTEPCFPYSENFLYFLSILLSFLNSDSAFMFLDKLLTEVPYEELLSKEFLEKERDFLLKNLLENTEENYENLSKILSFVLPTLYSGLFFNQNIDFQISMRLFERILEKPCITTLENNVFCLLRLNLENLIKIEFFEENPEKILEIISKNTNIEALDKELLANSFESESYQRDLFDLSQASGNEKVLTIEELNLTPEQQQQNNEKKPGLRVSLLGVFTEILNRIHGNSELSSFIVSSKTKLFSEYFSETPPDPTPKSLKSMGKRPKGLSCGGELLEGNDEILSKTQLELLRERIEVLERANDGLMKERMAHIKYEKELDNKVAELNAKSALFFQHFEGKIKEKFGENTGRFSQENTGRFSQENSEKIQEKHSFSPIFLPKKPSKISHTYKQVISVIESSMRELLEENLNIFAFSPNYLKVLLKEKLEDLRKLKENEALISNEEVVTIEVDKSLKVMRDFMGNCLRTMEERNWEMRGREHHGEKNDRNCKKCVIF